MKKYIILTSAIRNAGGAQQYAANKLSYMESHGWEPFVFFYYDGEIKINYLKKFAGYFIPELGNSVNSISNSVISRVLTKIAQFVKNDNDEIVVESDGLHLSFWGEIIAKSISAKHVMFPLEEVFWKISKREAAFFDFKIKRDEIMTGSQKRLKQVFQRYYQPEYSNHIHGVTAYCSNVVDYTPTEIPSELLTDDSVKILSIGRLKKPYIIPMLQDIKGFAINHPMKKISLIMIGGDNDPSIEQNIKTIFIDVKNVTLFMLGYVFPIPYDWIKISDVCIASSNSVLVSANEGIPTIVIDGHDLKAIGVFGFTTTNKVFRSEEPIISVSTLLDEILVEGKYPKTLKDNSQNDEFDKYFQPHLDFLQKTTQGLAYYDVNIIYPWYDCIKGWAKRIVREFIRK